MRSEGGREGDKDGQQTQAQCLEGKMMPKGMPKKQTGHGHSSSMQRQVIDLDLSSLGQSSSHLACGTGPRSWDPRGLPSIMLSFSQRGEPQREPMSMLPSLL